MSAPANPATLRLPRLAEADGIVTIHLDGEPVAAKTGESVAAALLAAGHLLLRTTSGGAARGLYCGMGVCWECAILVEGEGVQRACMVEVREGLRLHRLVGREPAR